MFLLDHTGYCRRILVHDLVVSWQSGTQRLTAHHGFWVRDVPTPFAYFAGRSSEQDFIPYGEAIAGRGVLAKILDETTLGVDFKISYRISHYLLTLERDRSIVYDGFASGPELTPTMAEATAGIQIGDILRASAPESHPGFPSAQLLRPPALFNRHVYIGRAHLRRRAEHSADLCGY